LEGNFGAINSASIYFLIYNPNTDLLEVDEKLLADAPETITSTLISVKLKVLADATASHVAGTPDRFVWIAASDDLFSDSPVLEIYDVGPVHAKGNIPPGQAKKSGKRPPKAKKKIAKKTRKPRGQTRRK
jgi:hypothetical protein